MNTLVRKKRAAVAALFSMLVLMAIVTTVMATPLFEAVYGRRARASGELGAVDDREMATSA